MYASKCSVHKQVLVFIIKIIRLETRNLVLNYLFYFKIQHKCGEGLFSNCCII